MNEDLSTIAILNESRRADVGGHLSLFRHVSGLARYVEPIDVRNGEYFAYTLAGQRLDLIVENGKVRVVGSDRQEDHSRFVRQLIEYAADTVLRVETKGRQGGRASIQGTCRWKRSCN
jgi:hypothetical protein